jgi:hypothetical protein
MLFFNIVSLIMEFTDKKGMAAREKKKKFMEN